MKDSDEDNREYEHIVIYMSHNVNEVCDMNVEVKIMRIRRINKN